MQTNGYDCGVFACMVSAMWLCRGEIEQLTLESNYLTRDCACAPCSPVSAPHVYLLCLMLAILFVVCKMSDFQQG